MESNENPSGLMPVWVYIYANQAKIEIYVEKACCLFVCVFDFRFEWKFALLNWFLKISPLVIQIIHLDRL